MNYVDSLNLLGVEAKEIPCIKGEGKPTAETVGAVGCLYMDTLTGDMYKCVNVEDNLHTWVNQADQTYNPESENAQSGKAVAEVEKKLCPNTDFDVSDFMQGDAQFWNSGNPSYTKYRVMCNLTKIYQYVCDITIKSVDGFRFSIGYYEDDKFKSDEGWNTEKTIPANQQFRIMIGRLPENNSEEADVEEFVSKLIILTDKLSEIYDKAFAKDITTKPSQVLAINHRGYSTVAPENTLPAYILSKKKGFDFVECDVRLTADGVPVLLHDPTINRTARNMDGSTIDTTINIANITYEQALQYDFGIWKGEQYGGIKIPTFEEFLNLCRVLSLHPYIELYGTMSTSGIELICNIIKKYKMEQNITFITSDYENLSKMADRMVQARYGFVSWDEKPNDTQSLIYWLGILQNKGVKNIFIDGDNNYINIDDYISFCKEKQLRLELYSVNTDEQMLSLDPFVTGFTTDGWEQI